MERHRTSKRKLNIFKYKWVFLNIQYSDNFPTYLILIEYSYVIFLNSSHLSPRYSRIRQVQVGGKIATHTGTCASSSEKS